MENNNPPDDPGKLNPFFVVVFILFFGFLIFLFIPLPGTEKINYELQIPFYVKKDITLKEMLRIGKQDLEHEDLLSKIRDDLKIPSGLEVKIFIGPYVNISGEGILCDSNHPFGLILLLDEVFYKNLTPEEKVALIGHELGHLTNEAFLIIHDTDTPIRFQIEADTYATKYSKPEAMISVLNKVMEIHKGFHSRQYRLKIENLEKIKQSQQGH